MLKTVRRTETQIVKSSDSRYPIFLDIAHKAKNLKNSGIYERRQSYFNTGKTINSNAIEKKFIKFNNPDYRALPAKVSKEILRVQDKDMKSYFALLSKKKAGSYNKQVRLPGYLPKKGYSTVPFEFQTFRVDKIKGTDLFKITLCKRDLGIEIFTKVSNPKQVRIKPMKGYFKVLVIYEIQVPVIDINSLKNKKYAAIDLGVNNLAAVFLNKGKPLLVNGKDLKSINRYFNKEIGKKKSQLPKGIYSSKKINYLWLKRDNVMKYLLEQKANEVVEHLKSENVSALVIGWNKGIKDKSILSKRTNQNFVQVPHAEFISKIRDRCEKEGIAVIETEESYTSKASFLDRDYLGNKYGFTGTRKYRGLYIDSKERKINADLNAAGNIMRKVFSDKEVYAKKDMLDRFLIK